MEDFSESSHIGATTVEFIQSKTLLTAPSGFMNQYKFTLNPYSGCSFGCDYCYARFFAAKREEKEHWGKWVKVKENAIALLQQSQRAKSPDRRLEFGDRIYMSSVTDPYQPIEFKLGLTRQILQELIPLQPRLTIQTRSPLVLRDVDLFQQFQHLRVNLSITTDSEDIRKRYEPHCPAISVRLKAAQKLSEAGIKLGISISPLLPIQDALSFGKKLAELQAAEYVTQYFKPTRSRFSAGSSPESLEKMKADDWTVEKYQTVRQILQQCLGNRPLLEGNQGYAPVG